MRLWHKDLIPVLPKQQLLSQWRECCCIARNIAVNGTPNHILVNKILDFPFDHFKVYAGEVYDEMLKRGYKVDWERFRHHWIKFGTAFDPPSHEDLFKDWHTDRYLKQCYFNLQEKHDCGGIPDDEWSTLCQYMYHRRTGR
jgi:uncharacterized protein (TIGR02328 family)